MSELWGVYYEDIGNALRITMQSRALIQYKNVILPV